jgi:hypothetical protein
MTRLLFVCFSLAAAACNNATGDDDGVGSDSPDAGTDPGPSPTSVVPRTGTWYYADANQVQNNCGYQIDGTAGDFMIDDASATKFHVDPDDGTEPFWCTLSNGSFVCPDRATQTEDLHPSFDAVITAHASATGTFSAVNRASGRQTATVNCAGSGCSALGSWPCTFKVDYDIAAR